MPVLRNSLHPSNCACVASIVGAVVLTFGTLPSQCRSAGVIVDSAGFESPTFSNGDINFQNGWKKATQTLGAGSALAPL